MHVRTGSVILTILMSVNTLYIVLGLLFSLQAGNAGGKFMSESM